jgi:hypothetical protein
MQIQLSSTTAASSRPSNRRWLIGILMMVLFLGLFAFQALAQEATIVGTVTDPSGAAVPNAKITITQLETGVVRHMATNEQGQYVVPNLPIGRYTVQVDAQGFKQVEQKNVTLAVGDRDRFDFKLQLGSTSEQVTVEAVSQGVQTETGEVSNVITGKQVENLATNGRSIYSLVNLTTGASSLQTDFQVPTPVGGDASVSFNGQRPGHNLYMVDGGEDYDRGSGGTFGIMPSLEAIAEFRQLTSNYSAQYGLSSAATMTTVLKSGTKTFHASAWEYDRNDALDARNYFNPAPNPVAELRYNTFGFNAGGQVPIAKDHPTFFFYNMEWRKLRQGGNYNVTVPLPSTYGGNLGATAIAVPDFASATPQVQASVLFKNCPGGVAPAGIASGQPFPNNTIPTCMLDPNAQAMLKAGIFPAPTNGTQFQGTPATPTDVREEIARIDHQFNDKFSIFGHWVSEQISQGFGTTIWSGDNVPTIGTTFGNPSYSAVVHATYIISPKLLNETAFNYNGNRIHITPVGTYAAPSDFTFNRVYTGPNALDRMPSIALNNTGTNYQSNWMPWNNSANSYQIRDDVSWSKGAHQLKMGASWELYSKIQDLFAPTQGAFNFNGRFTGNDFADFLLGLSNSYSENAVQDSGHWNATSWAAYIQDDWRATNRLTLNLGLRWDGIPHTIEVNGRESNFYPGLYDPTQAATLDPTNPNQILPTSGGLGTSPNPILAGYKFYLNGLGIAGQNGTPKGLVANHWANFGPRLGFSYDPTGGGNTVIRGGFGIMYERVQGNDMYNAATNPPFSGAVTLNDVSLSNPQLNVTTGAALNTATLPILVNSLSGLNADNYKHPMVMQYSFGVQRSITSKAVLSVSYVGSQSRHQSDYVENNLPAFGLLPTLIADPTPYNTDLPYLGYHSIRLANNEANGHYNSLQTSLSGQVTKDLYLSTGYTLSKSIDPLNANGGNSGGDLGNVSNPYVGWRYDLGPSPFDRTHIFFANYVYSLPFFRNSSSHLVETVAGGWQLSGIVSAQTGAPLNITTGGATSVCSVIPNCTNRPDLVSPVTYPHTVAQWFSTSSFSAPAPGTWGNLGNDALRGPGRFNWNMSLFKSFIFSESRGSRLEFRADAFNVFNHTQFGAAGANGGVSTNLQATNFGQITSAFEPRVFQLGAKLVF